MLEPEKGLYLKKDKSKPTFLLWFILSIKLSTRSQVLAHFLIKMKSPTLKWAIKPLVPEEVYTDREDFLDYFYRAALNARHRRTMSTVLLGQRRMGKTEIFKRVVNRLFFEQNHTDPNAVVPVYYSFPDTLTDRWDFAEKYVENFIRWYAAFRLHDTDLLSSETYTRHQLIKIIH